MIPSKKLLKIDPDELVSEVQYLKLITCMFCNGIANQATGC